MKRQILSLGVSAYANPMPVKCNAQALLELLHEGYVMDPSINSGVPLRTNDAIVYHLIKFDEGESAEQIDLDKPIVCEALKVEHGDVKTYFASGWRVKEMYSKNALIVKYTTERKVRSRKEVKT